MRPVKNCEFIPGPLLDFAPILKNWCKIVAKWCALMDWEDVPWWYSERSSLGLFGLAAWESGGVPLEEYSTKKGKRRGHWTGRGDLLISIKKRNYIIEAKQIWISLSRRAAKGERKLEDALVDAIDGARDSTEFRGKRVGIVFAVPYLHKTEKDFMVERLIEWIKVVKNCNDCAVAWVFPEDARHGFKLDGYLYPGISVLIRALRRPRATLPSNKIAARRIKRKG